MGDQEPTGDSLTYGMPKSPASSSDNPNYMTGKPANPFGKADGPFKKFAMPKMKSAKIMQKLSVKRSSKI
jgi:hypothetical protein